MTTPANPDDLTAWLRAQLDDDEEVASDAAGLGVSRRHWMREAISCVVDTTDNGLIVYGEGTPTPEQADHIVRWDPARVLRRVAADRRILDLHAIEVKVVDAPAFNPVTGERISDEYDVTCAVCGWVSSDPASACGTLRLMALPYADRPGYRSEWAPA